jgi:NAD(P)-dependent dehydrogenase (short-subunit alcohol dehydrogenase family)
VKRQGEGSLLGKVVIVTGASRGVGKQATLDFARRGASVVLAARTATRPCPSLYRRACCFTLRHATIRWNTPVGSSGQSAKWLRWALSSTHSSIRPAGRSATQRGMQWI